MNEFSVVYGSSVKHCYDFHTEAETVGKAVRNFRDEYGFNHIKIQYVHDLTNNEKYLMDYRKGWVKI